MAPKNKGKKSKKGDDDFWSVDPSDVSDLRYINDQPREKAGTSIEGNNATASGNVSDNEESFAKPKAGFSAYAALGLMEDVPADEEEDFGGLMVSLSPLLTERVISNPTSLRLKLRKRARRIRRRLGRRRTSPRRLFPSPMVLRRAKALIRRQLRRRAIPARPRRRWKSIPMIWPTRNGVLQRKRGRKERKGRERNRRRWMTMRRWC
jgi:hypothetical protein